jgi:hypothetical protein
MLCFPHAASLAGESVFSDYFLYMLFCFRVEDSFDDDLVPIPLWREHIGRR